MGIRRQRPVYAYALRRRVYGKMQECRDFVLPSAVQQAVGRQILCRVAACMPVKWKWSLKPQR